MIQEEKLKKRIDAGTAKKKAESESESESEDEMADFLKVKQSHKWGEDGGADKKEEADFNIIMDREVKESRKQKKQRFDGTASIREDGTAKGTSGSKKTTFDDDGNAVDDSVELVKPKSDRDELERDQEEFVRSVKHRMDAVKDEDKKGEKARLREKRMKLKGEKVEESESEEESGEGDGSNSGSGSESGSGSGSESGSDSGSDSDSDDDMDIGDMEAAALKMLNK
jgi:clumping factor A